MDRIENLPHSDLTGKILECCFEIMKELGCGFLENVYKNALCVAMKEKGMKVQIEQKYDVVFRKHLIGTYNADLVVNNLIIVELKYCKNLSSEHQAQVINYLKASGLPVGLLINFGSTKLEYKRLHHPTNSHSFPWEKTNLSS